MVVVSRTAPHWASLQETSAIWGIRLLVGVYRLCGRWAFRLILYPVVSFYFVRGSLARNASREYLYRLGQMQPSLGLNGSLVQSYRHFLSFAETILDKILAWSGSMSGIEVDFANRSYLLDLRERKQGALLLTGHIGNLELCQAIAHHRESIRLNILVHTRHAEKFNRLLARREESSCVRLIQVTELNPSTAIELQDKIAQGEFVVMVGDRVPIVGERTLAVDFLGAAADFPQGPYWLASLLRCPVYTLFCYPLAGRIRIDLQPFAEQIRIPRSEPERQQVLSTLARRYAEVLEGHCRIAPWQWFNFYPFWASAAARNAKELRE